MSIHRILVVEDSPTDQLMLREMLTRSGYQVATADSGERALELARSDPPDLILMDVVMPGMNGFQATRQFRRDDKLGQIPVILCSSKHQPTDRAWGLRQGACDYLTKPVREADLIGRIRALG
jgi:twitching motility two-component system response regulator PilH